MYRLAEKIKSSSEEKPACSKDSAKELSLIILREVGNKEGVGEKAYHDIVKEITILGRFIKNNKDALTWPAVEELATGIENIQRILSQACDKNSQGLWEISNFILGTDIYGEHDDEIIKALQTETYSKVFQSNELLKPAVKNTVRSVRERALQMRQDIYREMSTDATNIGGVNLQGLGDLVKESIEYACEVSLENGRLFNRDHIVKSIGSNLKEAKGLINTEIVEWFKQSIKKRIA